MWKTQEDPHIHSYESRCGYLQTRLFTCSRLVRVQLYLASMHILVYEGRSSRLRNKDNTDECILAKNAVPCNPAEINLKVSAAMDSDMPGRW